MIYKHINPDNGRIFVSVSPGPSGCYVGYWIVGFWDVGDLCGGGGVGKRRGGVGSRDETRSSIAFAYHKPIELWLLFL